jgi:hypothetical protein
MIEKLARWVLLALVVIWVQAVRLRHAWFQSRSWLRWVVWQPIKDRWFCWRRGLVPLAGSIVVHDISAEGASMVMGPLPGQFFMPGIPTPIYANLVRSRLSLDVENIENHPVRFEAVAFIRLGNWQRSVLPFLPAVLAAYERRTFTVTLTEEGLFDGLLIPEYVSKSLRNQLIGGSR